MGCYRHYDEDTGLYTVSFFGTMTAKDFYNERVGIYADIERYLPQKRLLDYCMCHPKVNAFELHRLSTSERKDLYEGAYSALVVNTSLKRGMSNLYLTLSGAVDHIKAFNSLVDAKLWLNSQPTLAAAGARNLRLLGVIVLLLTLHSTWEYHRHRHHLTIKPAKIAVAKQIRNASTKS